MTNYERTGKYTVLSKTETTTHYIETIRSYDAWKICENGFTIWAGNYFHNKSDAEEDFFERAYGAMSDTHEYWKR